MTAIEIGVLLLLSLVIGAWIGVLILKLSRIPPSNLPLFVGGFLMGLIGFTLLPHAFKDHEISGLLIGFAGSLLLFALLHPYAHRSRFNTSFTFMAMAIAFHTIPFCMAIGAINDPIVTQTLTLAVILHHIPEATALTLWVAGRNEKLEKLFLFFVFLTGLAMVSIHIGKGLSISDSFNSVLIGVSVGLLLLMLLNEIKELRNNRRKRIAGYAMGCLGLASYWLMQWILTMIGM